MTHPGYMIFFKHGRFYVSDDYRETGTCIKNFGSDMKKANAVVKEMNRLIELR